MTASPLNLVTAPIEADAGELLYAIRSYIRTYCVLGDEQLAAVALWTLHTHTFAACDHTPYLYVSSPEKRSGKTTLLGCIRELVARPLSTTNISEAALFRVIEANEPTLLFDEIDAIFSPKARDKEELRGLLNSGFRRGDKVVRCGGVNKTTLEEFSTFCPKMLAGIGATTLPDTISDRAIEIRMRRKMPTDQVSRARHRIYSQHAEPIRDSVAAWALRATDLLYEARPDLPDELDDRAQDIWEPLLAIADLAGGDWPATAREAALALSNVDRENESYRGSLLKTIYGVLVDQSAPAIFTRDLIKGISEDDEAGFGNWWDDHKDEPAAGITRRLSSILRDFGLPKPQTVRDGDKTAKGYYLEAFNDPFERYLGGSTLPLTTHQSHPSQPLVQAALSVTESDGVTE